jgi:[ribosomal protein S18]-alanine N-acetyltransferase
MTSPLRVRRFRLSDFPSLLAIEDACFAEDAYDRNLFAEFLHKCGDLFLVAARGKSICGYSVACPRGGSRGAEVVSIAVDPAARGNGVASTLLAGTLRRLRSRGISRVSLMVRTTNEPALALYRKHGFRRIRVVPKYYEDGEDGLLFARMV